MRIALDIDALWYEKSQQFGSKGEEVATIEEELRND
jgi:hypothetical protein